MNTNQHIERKGLRGESISQSEETWKEKYFSALEDLEKEEKTNKQYAETLRRGLLSVSLAGDGLTESLDVKLSELRAELKKGDDSNGLAIVLRGIEKDLKSLESNSITMQDASRSTIESTLSFLQKSSLDKHIKTELKQLHDQFKTSNNQNSGLRSFEGELLRLFLPIIVELSSDYLEKNPSEGLWQRFRKTIASSEQDPADLIKEKALRDSVPKSTELTADERNNLDPDYTKGFIRKLLSTNYGNNAFAGVAKDLEKESELASPSALPEVYPKIINFLDLSRTQEKRSFIDCLESVSISLSKVENSTKSQLNTQNRLSVQDEFQSRMMRKAIGKIRNVTETAEDLEALKSNTLEQLDSIVTTLDSSAAKNAEIFTELTEKLEQQELELESLGNRTSEVLKSIDSSAIHSKANPLSDKIEKSLDSETFFSTLKEELTAHKKKNESLCICLVEIIELEKISSEFGQKASEKAVALLTKEIAQLVGDNELLSYVGHGRFHILKRYTNSESAENQLQELTSSLDKITFKYKDSDVSVSLLFSHCESRGDDAAELLLQKVEESLSQNV